MGRVHRKKVLGRLVLAAAAGVLASAFMPLTAISVPAAGASTTADHDGDLVADIADLDDDNDGLADDTECDGSAAGARFVDDATNNRLGLELRPSDLGMAVSDAGVTTSLDLSDRFGYTAGSGAVIVTAAHANRHPSADVFIGGVNPVADGAPTRFTFSGTLGVYLDIRHDLQWFDNDVKTLETHDGTELTDWFQLASPSYSAPGFSKSESVGANGEIHTITGPPTVNPYPTTFYNGYSSELAGSIPNLRFVQPTTEFSFSAALVHPGLYPVINVFMYAECDTDLDGVADRLDTDSDGDACPDVNDGTASFQTPGVVSVTTPPASLEVDEGSPATFEVEALAQSTTTFVVGVPDTSAGIPEPPTYQWSVSADNGATFSPLSGANSASFLIDPVTSAVAGNQYRVRVASESNPCGVDSAAAVLSVRQTTTTTTAAAPTTTAPPTTAPSTTAPPNTTTPSGTTPPGVKNGNSAMTPTTTAASPQLARRELAATGRTVPTFVLVSLSLVIVGIGCLGASRSSETRSSASVLRKFGE